MKLLRLSTLLLISAVTCHAMGDKTVFDTTPPPPTPNPRDAAPFVIGVELGINSLGSLVGGHFTWYPFQQVALDLGGGWSLAGMRGGVGARYFLFDGFNSPFVGASWMRSGGVDLDSSTLDGKTPDDKPHYRVNNIQWVNALVGYEIRRPDGLSLTFTTGWSFATTPEKDRYNQISGSLSSSAQDWLDYSTGSGPVASILVGYGF
jgi:hypothetical protein